MPPVAAPFFQWAYRIIFMAIATTIPALACVPVCDTQRTIGEQEFLDYLIDRLVTTSGVALSSLTSANLRTAVDTALCAIEGRTSFSTVSPETKRAIALYLASQS
jgi:hypothetical protein